MNTSCDGQVFGFPYSIRSGTEDELPSAVSIDDDACRLFDDVGLGMELPPEHAAFLETERSHWAAAAAAGRLYFAISAEEPIGFAALGLVDGAPYLAQMSVRRAHMRRGVGTALLARAIACSATYGELWLTTYVHLAWNQPYYQRFGFVAVDERDCGDELQAVLRSERQALPSPNNRTAMVLRHHNCHA